jgi:Tol biopolymer transport system component
MVPEFFQSVGESPTWSPNDELLAFHRIVGDAGIYIVDTLSGALEKILDGTEENPRELAWAPDGSQIAMVLDHDIWTLRLGDRTLVQWTNAASWFQHWPTWSPDGEYILYSITALRAGDPDSAWGLHVIDTNDGTSRGIRRKGGDVVTSLGPAQFSSDGQAIVLTSSVTSGRTIEVFTVSLVDSTYRQVTYAGGRAANPQWLGKSRRILFDLSPPNCPVVGSADRATWHVLEDGSGLMKWPVTLGDPRVFGGFPPSITRDGTRAAFVGLSVNGRMGVIKTMGIDGSNEREVAIVGLR